MRLRASFVGIVGLVVGGLVACAKTPAKPAPPPAPPPPQLGQACRPAEPGGQGNCAAGLTCTTVAGASFCSAACPCAGGVLCAATPAAPEMCLKPCTTDDDCGSGLACDGTWRACAPAGMLVAAPPACSAAAPERRSFGKVTQISQVAGAHDPAVILDKNGNLVIVYAAGGAQSKLYAAAADVAGEITVREADKVLDWGRENGADPWLAMDRNGRLYLAALGWNGGLARRDMTIGVATSEDGVAWSAPVTAHDAATDCAGDAPGCLDKPLVVVGRDRDATTKGDVVYLLYWSNVSNGLRATHSIDAGKTYSPSVPVGTGAFADGEVTSSGKLHIVYAAGVANRMGDPGNGIFYTSSVDSGESFAAPVRVSSESEPVPYWFNSARVVVDVPRGLLYSVYVQGTPDGRWDVMLATSRDGGVSFSSQKVNDDDACATHMLPAAALDPSTGRIHIAWLDNRSGSGSVAYASCSAAGRSCGKNETISEAPFAAFGYGRDSAQTLGDYISLIYDARHKMLHAVWGQPVQEGGQTATRLFHAGARAGR